MDIKDKGKMGIEECNDANIPVNCFIISPDDNEDKKWHWLADNFMPRKGYCGESMYDVVADTKEDLLQAVKKYIVPLYQIALNNLTIKGTNYYWSKKY